MTAIVASGRDTDNGHARAGVRIDLPVHLTPTACAGAVASYVLRRVAYRAGAYAPGIDDALFSELHTSERGRTIEDVQRWFVDRSRTLGDLGYRFEARRLAWSTSEVAAWIESGRGYRGAVLATSYARFHPRSDAGEVTAHAVGLTWEDAEHDEAIAS